MNKQIFTAVCDRLASEVAALKWIDFDDGQLDMQTERVPVALPCCVVDISYPRCENLDDVHQNCNIEISLRFAFQPTGSTEHASPVRATALSIFDTMQAAHTAMQGWRSIAKSAPLSRVSAKPEKRRDGIKVYRFIYSSEFYDL